MTDLYSQVNEWYVKLKQSGFKDIELDWAKGKHNIRSTLKPSHPSGKRAEKKYQLSQDTSILLERYARCFITDAKELNFFIDVAHGESIRKAAVANKLKKYRGIYLINKAMNKIKSDLKLDTVPDYLRCEDTVEFNKIVEEENAEE